MKDEPSEARQAVKNLRYQTANYENQKSISPAPVTKWGGSPALS